jgi:bacterioferritin-associated ferredoxin
MTQSSNPLKQFFRQPVIYVRLPSNGEFWPEGSLIMPTNRELPVYPMTAIDEITYRTPDALYNGQAVINVIQSCIPNIRNAWGMPAVDTNAILVAIRIASYGHELELSTRCPSCETESEYSVDLRAVLDGVTPPDFRTPTVFGDLEINFRPMDYKMQNETNQLQFEQQQQIQAIQFSDISDDEKIAALNASLKKITELTMDALKWSIASIRTPNALVTEPEYIHEFLINCDSKIYNQIRDRIITLRQDSEIKPLQIQCSNCQHEYKQDLSLDQTSFFAPAS